MAASFVDNFMSDRNYFLPISYYEDNKQQTPHVKIHLGQILADTIIIIPVSGLLEAGIGDWRSVIHLWIHLAVSNTIPEL